MIAPASETLTSRLIDSLYTEAMLLADEARFYFEDAGRADRAALDPLTRVAFSCESLKVTTRLMYIVAWLMTRRAFDAGELGGAGEAPADRRAARKLGEASDSSAATVAQFPPVARAMISASCDLYARVKRLENGSGVEDSPSPARALMRRLERTL